MQFLLLDSSKLPLTYNLFYYNRFINKTYMYIYIYPHLESPSVFLDVVANFSGSGDTKFNNSYIQNNLSEKPLEFLFF